MNSRQKREFVDKLISGEISSEETRWESFVDEHHYIAMGIAMVVALAVVIPSSLLMLWIGIEILEAIGAI